MNKNEEIASLFQQIADALEIKGENPFRVNAYRQAARVLSELSEDIRVLLQQGKLTEIQGIGPAMAEKIEEYLATGKMAKYQEALSGLSPGLLALLQIPGMGPKTVSLLHKKLQVNSLEDLERELNSGRLEALPGFGRKKVENLRKGLQVYRQGQARIPLGPALTIVRRMVEMLSGSSSQISPAGSLRRFKETVGDIDILATGRDLNLIIEKFTHLPGVQEVIARGETKASVRIAPEGLQVDLRVVAEDSYGAALQYFTGSKAHNIKLRSLAVSSGYKINEYGVFRGQKRVGGKTEEEVYRNLRLPFIPPELREDRGEIEAALKQELPQLITMSDIQGDFHVHSHYSDGKDDLRGLAEAARKRGYKWLAIADHSVSVKYAHGLTSDDLMKKLEEIDQVQREFPDVWLLKAAEVDILPDGKLDYPDWLLSRLDVVIAAIHQGFSKNVTERVIAAIEHPLVDIIAHPTGRLLTGRSGYQIDLEKVMERAAERSVALEINAYFDRLDLNDVNAARAKSLGVPLAIGTDAHSQAMLSYMELGVATARRAWLTKNDILNTRPWIKRGKRTNVS
ncbi:MAG: DNA polymerase/3'-5' exonuclease PolX [Candidatus Omnitrophica bacterium]|nr:DNA polymerase/3'-5' exonuclease PolX [Candidatus Omnitrophota bacterium]